MESERFHVLPINDLKEHIGNGEWCHCKPEIRASSEGVIILHNAYDGREFFESQYKEERDCFDFIIETNGAGWLLGDTILVIDIDNSHDS